MSLKYLNLTGLSNLVTNIKNWVIARIPTKTSEITNDSGFISNTDNCVHTTGDETVAGEKTFTAFPVVKPTNANNGIIYIKSPTTFGTSPSTATYTYALRCVDNAGTILADFLTQQATTGTNLLQLRVRNTDGTNVYDRRVGLSVRDTDGYTNFSPNVDNVFYLGTASYRWKAVYSNAYYLGSTAFGNIVTHDSSEYSPISHTHAKADITDFPTIPTVNNATLTIQKNGTTVKTFTANASSNVTCNITVPTKTSDLTNDSGFLTSHQSLSNYSTLANTVKSLSISGKTITVTPGSGSTYTLTTQDTVYTHPTTAGNKHIPSGGAANQYLKYSASGTAVWADLPTIPTKTSELTNDSGFLTSHQSLSGYLPLTGGTVTGATYFTTDYYRKDTGAVRGTAPSANRWQNGVRFVDNNNVAFGGIERGYLSDRTNRVNMIVYKGTTTNTSENAQIGVGFDKNGNWFTYSPTPAANDNTTKIATTAWVQTFCDTTKGYLTSHQSLSNYVTLNGDQTISGTKTFSTDQWLLSSSNIYWRLKNTSWEAGSAAPSSTVEIGGITYRDKNNANMAYIIGFDWSSGNSGLKLLWRNKFSSGARSTSGSNVDCTLILGVTSAGVQYFEGNGRWNNNVVPLATDSKTLGTSSLYWKGAYVITQYMGGDIVFNGTYNLRSNADNSYVRIQGGSGEGKGSRIILSGKTRSGLQGFAEIVATDGTNTNTFTVKPNGETLVNGNNLAATIIKGLSISGKTITYTQINGSTGTITTQDTVYTHPTSAGNKHIPSGGSTGQILRYSASGTAVWANRGAFVSIATRSIPSLTSSGSDSWTITTVKDCIYLLKGSFKLSSSGASITIHSNGRIIGGYGTFNSTPGTSSNTTIYNYNGESTNTTYYFVALIWATNTSLVILSAGNLNTVSMDFRA